MKSRVVFSSKSDEWATPQDLYDQLNEEFHFELDCAATAENTKCPRYLSDALNVPWAATNWLNPPYSLCKEFVAKAFAECYSGHTTVLLLPSRTDTRWWHDFVWDRTFHAPYKGIEVRFIKGRLKFGGSTNSAPFPSVVVVMRGQ